MKNRGFTLIEFLVVLGVVAISFTATLPNLISFQQERILNSNSQEVVSVLRSAQKKSVDSTLESGWGVKINSDNYTLFKGDSFTDRKEEFDQDFNLREGVYFSLVDLESGQVLFEKGTGTSKNGEIQLSFNSLNGPRICIEKYIIKICHES